MSALETRPSRFWMKDDPDKRLLGSEKPIDPIDMNEEQLRIYNAVGDLFTRMCVTTPLTLDFVLDKVSGFNEVCRVRSVFARDGWQESGRQLGDEFSLRLTSGSESDQIIKYRLLSDTAGTNFYLQFIG
jgi:hypothetical protein